MKISLSEIMQIAGGTFSQEVFCERRCYEEPGRSFPFQKNGPVSLNVLHSGNRKIHLSLQGEVILSVPCDRCLREVSVPITLQTERDIDFSKSPEERAAELDETNYVNGYDLDVDAFVCEEIMLLFPMKVLCQEDCKGICKVCGANLNDGECGCDRTELDPRMSVIKDIYNNFKEV